MESAYPKGVITLNYAFILRRLNQPTWHQQDSSPWKKPQPEYLTADRGLLLTINTCPTLTKLIQRLEKESLGT